MGMKRLAGPEEFEVRIDPIIKKKKKGINLAFYLPKIHALTHI